MNLEKRLFTLRDEGYKKFNSSLIPTVSADTVIGIRTPQLRKLAKELIKSGEAERLLRELPHRYFEGNQLHAFIISEEKDFDRCVDEVNRFLPYVDNWATCDQMNPRVFSKNKDEILHQVKIWIESKHTYTVRFGVKVLMDHFLGDDFEKRFCDMVAEIRSEEYYINMMRAWYFATALAKQYETAVSFIEGRRIDMWTHNKAIQKAVESRRISPEQKDYLRTLRWRGGGSICTE